ncbi:MBL fold metallo-hydrolase [Labrys monachus]|uniref:Glyoxylase-like metal-dependent hydrolase (Beta-lactamase superfamily II) n=1 Tax=Labrys monachus TaxID=217067 RepID=A0ABU0FNR4_9HYPH|nr:MBL fold metallo-hydrolase [Labrys monachus]MDQ0396247.1 glyoxylase-like metal-dependent hydrolase (beta-lactamase superfamily II) [Labrys monachus]
MPDMSRREVLRASAFAAAVGLAAPVFLVGTAGAETVPGPATGFHRYRIGSVEVTALYDGIWRKPHDPAFIRNASIAETKAALAAAGQVTDYMPIPLTVQVLDFGDHYVMIDAGSGAQWQPTAGHIAQNMQAAGIDPAKIRQILISHFHPDHVFGLMDRDTNALIYPDAELVVSAAEYKWWTAPERVGKLPPERKALGTRIAKVFPAWKNWRLVEGEAEVAPGIRLLPTPGHTPGHSAFHLTSGTDQLMLSNDVAYVPALLAPHPDWQGAYDQDGPAAVVTRRKLLDRVVAEAMPVAGAHFPFPGAGRFARDGSAYAFTPVTI